MFLKCARKISDVFLMHFSLIISSVYALKVDITLVESVLVNLKSVVETL